MGDAGGPEIGSFGWTDLTVDDAEGIRDFYADVVEWRPSPVDMGGYSDFTMATPETGTPVAGVCHARGSNADLPTQWLVYIVVESLDRSVERCRSHGGEVLAGPRELGGHGRFAVIRDPAGAVAALFEPTR